VHLLVYLKNIHKHNWYCCVLGVTFDSYDQSCEANKTSIQINHQTNATIFQFIILTCIYSKTCFGRSPAYHQKLNDCSSSLWFYLCIVVTVLLCSWSGRLTTAHHHDSKVKPEAATAVVELLLMGGRTPETCWAVNKRQNNKLKICCNWLVIFLNCTVMHGLTNLKL
jgi:hypothetical protein